MLRLVPVCRDVALVPLGILFATQDLALVTEYHRALAPLDDLGNVNDVAREESCMLTRGGSFNDPRARTILDNVSYFVGFGAGIATERRRDMDDTDSALRKVCVVELWYFHG